MKFATVTHFGGVEGSILRQLCTFDELRVEFCDSGCLWRNRGFNFAIVAHSGGVEGCILRQLCTCEELKVEFFDS